MVKVIINGEEVELSSGTLAYEDIARISRTIEPSITFRHSVEPWPGALFPGESVIVQDGTVFNAFTTGNA